MKKNMEIRGRGRPAKGERVKVGLSISKRGSQRLDRLSKKASMTKSDLVEEALELYFKNKAVLDKNVRAFNSGKVDSITDFDKIETMAKV